MMPRRSRLAIAVVALLLAGSVRAHLGVDEQIEQINAEIAAAPTDGELYLRRGELHRIHGNWDLAGADYRTALQLAPQMEAVDLAYGTMLLDADRPAEAIAPLQRFLQRRPEHVRGWVALGRAQTGIERHDEAVRSFDRAITVHDPDSFPRPEFYLERARALSRLTPPQLPRAIEGLDQGCERLGDPITLALLAIEFELELKRYDAAIGRIDKIANRLRRNETWLLRKGEILEIAGRTEEAQATYRQALDALDALPATRRRNRAVQRLREQAQAALTRLEGAAATTASDG